MNSQEQITLNTIQALYQSLSKNGESWSTIVFNYLNNFETSLFNDSIQDKYIAIKQVLGMYGGMGSINDQGFDTLTNSLKDTTYIEALNLLKSYWKDMGNEYHQDDSFQILPIGTMVKFIPNTIRYFDKNQTPMYIESSSKHLETIWKVISNQLRDITNMIEYGIYANGTYSTARHTSLRILS